MNIHLWESKNLYSTILYRGGSSVWREGGLKPPYRYQSHGAHYEFLGKVHGVGGAKTWDRETCTKRTTRRLRWHINKTKGRKEDWASYGWLRRSLSYVPMAAIGDENGSSKLNRRWPLTGSHPTTSSGPKAPMVVRNWREIGYITNLRGEERWPCLPTAAFARKASTHDRWLMAPLPARAEERRAGCRRERGTWRRVPLGRRVLGGERGSVQAMRASGRWWDIVNAGMAWSNRLHIGQNNPVRAKVLKVNSFDSWDTCIKRFCSWGQN
jgi:hypothetical protein